MQLDPNMTRGVLSLGFILCEVIYFNNVNLRVVHHWVVYHWVVYHWVVYHWVVYHWVVHHWVVYHWVVYHWVVHHWVVYHLLPVLSWGSLGTSGGWRRCTLCSMSGEMVHEAAIHRHSQLELRAETHGNKCTLEFCDLIL